MIFLTKVGSALLLQSNTLNPSLIILPYTDHCCLLHVDRLQQQAQHREEALQKAEAATALACELSQQVITQSTGQWPDFRLPPSCIYPRTV